MRPKIASRVDKAGAVVCLATLGAEQQDFPSQTFWEWPSMHAPWLVPSLIILSAFFSLGPLGASADGGLIKRRTHLQREILIEFGKILDAAISVSPTLQLDDVGLHVWQVRWRRKSGVLPERYLRRVSTYRIGGSVVLREFQPSKGKGVVGQCWKHNREVNFDVELIRAAAPNEVAYTAIYAARPDEVMALTWAEFNAVSHRGSVFASPIRNSRQEFKGCLSLDFQSQHATMKGTSIPEILNALADRMTAHEFEEM